MVNQKPLMVGHYCKAPSHHAAAAGQEIFREGTARGRRRKEERNVQRHHKYRCAHPIHTHSLAQSGGENRLELTAESESEARMDKHHFPVLVEEKSWPLQLLNSQHGGN